ncbi:DUF4259 domain-containing protein [Hymenobacter sp. BT664]|uniref:DUF4259 domain-containing protein n=1 Tax=Hymenobacter montanus TaxID=2771359 RepID=A0A927BAH9_9BACT|nr:DUF4259 domain-containing protein [Hymenobacter montanus]MBD2766876.1 DUF4259 domain-containing protein [Hymenobacter montanus]
MGTWGSGNFDSDDALDYLSDIANPLVEKLMEVVENPELADADEESNHCMAAVEILTMLSQYYSDTRLNPQFVADCRRTVLTQWDETIDELDPDPDYKVARRQVMEQSFDKLLAVVKHWQ